MEFNQNISFILERPEFFEVESVRDLKILIVGFRIGCTARDEELLYFSNKFTNYVRSYYDVKTSQSWDMIITFFSTSGKNSLEEFKERFSEFINLE